MMIHQNQILGVILCGGENSRMGGQPKWQLSLQDKPIMEHILERLSSQVSHIILNGSHSSLQQYHLPIVDDSIKGSQGPLAGILAGLEYAAKHDYQWVVSCPCDTPFFPHNLVEQFVAQPNDPDSPHSSASDPLCVVARHQQRLQGVFGLWHISMQVAIRHQLVNSGVRSLHGFFNKNKDYSTVDFDDSDTNSFFNINSPEELQTAQTLASTHQQ